jgi:hypothetical protein
LMRLCGGLMTRKNRDGRMMPKMAIFSCLKLFRLHFGEARIVSHGNLNRHFLFNTKNPLGFGRFHEVNKPPNSYLFNIWWQINVNCRQLKCKFPLRFGNIARILSQLHPESVQTEGDPGKYGLSLLFQIGRTFRAKIWNGVHSMSWWSCT